MSLAAPASCDHQADITSTRLSMPFSVGCQAGTFKVFRARLIARSDDGDFALDSSLPVGPIPLPRTPLVAPAQQLTSILYIFLYFMEMYFMCGGDLV
jgi:hypothetical protein